MFNPEFLSPSHQLTSAEYWEGPVLHETLMRYVMGDTQMTLSSRRARLDTQTPQDITDIVTAMETKGTYQDITHENVIDIDQLADNQVLQLVVDSRESIPKKSPLLTPPIARVGHHFIRRSMQRALDYQDEFEDDDAAFDATATAMLKHKLPLSTDAFTFNIDDADDSYTEISRATIYVRPTGIEEEYCVGVHGLRIHPGNSNIRNSTLFKGSLILNRLVKTHEKQRDRVDGLQKIIAARILEPEFVLWTSAPGNNQRRRKKNVVVSAKPRSIGSY